jgi:hypothetical protein
LLVEIIARSQACGEIPMELVVSSHLLTTITALIHHSFDSSQIRLNIPRQEAREYIGGMERRINGPYWPEISDYAAVRSWPWTEGARVSDPVFRPDGARRRPTFSHGLRRGLQSYAASRLTQQLRNLLPSLLRRQRTLAASCLFR